MAQQVLNIEYQDMAPEVLEFAKTVSGYFKYSSVQLSVN